MQMTYIYTTYGEVYSGAEWNEMNFRDYTIIIEFSNVREYRELSHTEKTFEKISEYGWIIPNNAIAKRIDDPNFDPPKYQHEERWWKGEYQRDILFIFGAGASANCVTGADQKEFEADPLRPPIGPALFERRFKNYFKKYKGVNQSLPILQSDVNPDVEELIEEEWTSIQRNNNQAILSRHISIQYYLQELLHDISKNTIENYYAKNLYALLAYKLQKKFAENQKQKFAFISFNQDTLLETFLSEYFKAPLNSMSDYNRFNDYPFCVFKPHGSCNWGWKFPNTSQFGASTANWLFDNDKNFFQIYYQLLGNHVDMVNWGAWGHEKSINKNNLGKHSIDKSKLEIIPDGNFNNYFPALLLPYRDKDEFIMPLQHFYDMDNFISTAKTLVIIGWKGNEAAFNRTFKLRANGVQKIIVVDPNPEAVKQNLDFLFSNDRIEKQYFKTFDEFVNSDFEKHIIPVKQMQH